MKRSILLIAAMVILFTACQDSGGTSVTASKLGFNNPQALFLAGEGTTTRQIEGTRNAGTADTLFQVLSDGTVQKVPVYDSNGNELTVRIDDIQKLTDDYLAVRMIIEKGTNGEASIPYGLLVEKSSGKVYDLTKYAITASCSAMNKAPVVWGDYIYATASIFVNDGHQTLYRINMKTLTAEPMNLESEIQVADFAHISNGDFLYSEWTGSNPPLKILFGDAAILPVDAKPAEVSLSSEWFYTNYISADDSSLCEIKISETTGTYSIVYRTFSAAVNGLQEVYSKEMYSGTDDCSSYFAFSGGDFQYSYLYVFNHGYLEISGATGINVQDQYHPRNLSVLFSSDISSPVEKNKRLFWLSGGSIKYFDIVDGTEVKTVAGLTGVTRISRAGNYLICTRMISAVESQTCRIDLTAPEPHSTVVSNAKMEIDKIVEFNL